MAKSRIPFSGEMVRAILDGKKTQTRRVIKPQPPEEVNCVHPWKDGGFELGYCHPNGYDGHMIGEPIYCPYGQPGHALYVTETWCAPFLKEQVKPSEMPLNTIIRYRADGLEYSHWHPSIFMPKRFSRIKIRVTDVRVQQIQDITEEDAKAEGFEKDEWGSIKVRDKYYHYYVFAFRALWNQLNEKRGYSWEENPWVFAITFERVE